MSEGDSGTGDGGASGSGGALSDGGSSGTGGVASGGGPGSGGTSGDGGTDDDGGAGGGPIAPGAMPAHLPDYDGPCPDFQTGTTTFEDITLWIWAATSSAPTPGPFLYYDHSRTSAVSGLSIGEEVELALGPTVIDDVTSSGGMIVAPEWPDLGFQDIAILDKVVACALKEGNVHPRRIHAFGTFRSAWEVTFTSRVRSGYLASIAIHTADAGIDIDLATPQDANHLPPALMTYRSEADGEDEGIRLFRNDLRARGAYVVECVGENYDFDGYEDAMLPDLPGWEFLKDHPYGVDPEPYGATLPDGYPPDCEPLL